MNNAATNPPTNVRTRSSLTAALYIGAEGIGPKGTGLQIVTTTAVAPKVLPIAAKHHTQL